MSTAILDSPTSGDIGDPADAATSQIVSFRLANEEYGVEIMHVQEIILIGHSTVMPKVPGYVRGLINLRGHVIPIIDLRVRFYLEADVAVRTRRQPITAGCRAHEAGS